MARLLDETSQHFQEEELILEEIGFPSMDQHVAEHARLLARALQLSEDFKASTLGDVFQFLASEVVMRHMLEADRKFFPLINETGAADKHPAEGT